jgi:hypothetical protein
MDLVACRHLFKEPVGCSGQSPLRDLVGNCRVIRFPAHKELPEAVAPSHPGMTQTLNSTAIQAHPGLTDQQ